MRYVDEFRDPELGRVLATEILAAVEEAMAILHALLDDARRRASPLDLATWRTAHGTGLLHLGRLAEAERELEAAVTRAASLADELAAARDAARARSAGVDEAQAARQAGCDSLEWVTQDAGARGFCAATGFVDAGSGFVRALRKRA